MDDDGKAVVSDLRLLRDSAKLTGSLLSAGERHDADRRRDVGAAEPETAPAPSVRTVATRVEAPLGAGNGARPRRVPARPRGLRPARLYFLIFPSSQPSPSAFVQPSNRDRTLTPRSSQ